MSSFKYTIVFTLGFLFISCADDKKQAPAEPEVKTVEKEFYHEAGELNADFKTERVETAFKAYIEVKNAMVNTDAAKTAEAAKNLKVAMTEAGAETGALEEVERMSSSSNIAEQREAFVDVTAAMEGLLTDELEGGTIYKQYCPMAFDNSGASWLSESKDIANPYFGNKMYRCGRIEAVIE